MKAECLVFLKRFQEAQEIVNSILNSIDKQNVDAIYVRGMCMYYMDNIERAFTHFQHVLKLAPDHSKTVDIYKVNVVEVYISGLFFFTFLYSLVLTLICIVFSTF